MGTEKERIGLVAPMSREGLEPSADGLKARCSTD